MACSPLALRERIAAHEALKRISKNTTSTSEIICELLREGHAMPSRATIRLWMLGRASPLTGIRVFSPRPCYELSFFIAAWLGDGWGDENDGGKRMRMKVRSESFAEEFARVATLVLSKRKPYGVWVTYDERGPWYNVKVTSIMLYQYVNQGFSFLKGVIEESPCGFLRGFATAEGCPTISISKRRGPRLDVGI